MKQPPEAPIRFILDETSGSLLKWLRLLGFDAIYRREYKKPVAESQSGREIYLLHSSHSLYGSETATGIQLEPGPVAVQLRGVMTACGITRERVKPFSRCTVCNEATQRIEKPVIRGKIPDYVWETHEVFSECPVCGRIYWRGTHAENISRIIQRIFEGIQGPRGQRFE